MTVPFELRINFVNSIKCCLPVHTVDKSLLTSTVPFFRCVDRRVGGHWCLSCHCKWVGHWCIFRLHPSTGVPLPLWPMCQWHNISRYWVRMCILLENVDVLSCCVQHSLLNTFFYFSSCMAGYINNSLSIARMDDQNLRNEFSANQMITPSGLNVSYCRFVFFIAEGLFNWLISDS